MECWKGDVRCVVPLKFRCCHCIVVGALLLLIFMGVLFLFLTVDTVLVRAAAFALRFVVPRVTVVHATGDLEDDDGLESWLSGPRALPVSTFEGILLEE